LSIFIFTSKKHDSRASSYLGLLILAFTFANLQYSIEEIGLISYQIFNYIYFPFIFLIAPFLYYFIKTYLVPKTKFNSKEKLLFLPFFVFLLITIVYKILSLFFHQTQFIKRITNTLIVVVDYYSDLIIISLTLFVIIVSIIEIKKYEKKQLIFNSNIVTKELFWLKTLLITFFLICLIWLYFTIQYIIDASISYYPMYLIVSFLIYIFGYVGIHKIGILKQRKKIRSFSNRKPIQTIVYKNKHIIAIDKLLIEEDKILDATLNLDTIASELGLSKAHISRLINNELGMSFTDYINKLRVEKAKEYLKNPSFSNYTILTIGLEAGFNSKTTFNKVFKKLTQLTPSQYKKEN